MPLARCLFVLDYPLDVIQILDEDLQLCEEIGSGGYGIVYRAIWLSRHFTVAAKKLYLTRLNDKAEKDFLRELSLMSTVRCPYIVNFIGACTERGKYTLVMEYMSLGSLYKVLHKDQLLLVWSQRMSIALQTAKAINYLHQLQPPILHRDVKSLNFLLERAHGGYTVKVCDFGLSLIRNETSRQTTSSNTPVVYTLPWTAPEILRLGRYTDKSDIYSLGIVYWELATNQIPYDGYDVSVVREFVLAGERLEIPKDKPSSFRKVIKKCWAHETSDRPSSTSLIELVEACLHPIQTRDNSYNYPPCSSSSSSSNRKSANKQNMQNQGNCTACIDL
jgi:serine/threonine-protein kinase CTR1